MTGNASLTRRRFGGLAGAGLLSSACADTPDRSTPEPTRSDAEPSRADIHFERLEPRARLLERKATSFAEVPDVQVESLVYDSGGVRVEAYLVCPLGALDAPAVVYARGGGMHGDVNPFIISVHLAPLARAGFCVVATQYRKPPHGRDEFGGVEVADLVNVVALLEQLPEADPSRVGLVGWSRGAMMVHLALAHAPSAFRAAVCAAGAADQGAELERRPELEEIFTTHVPDFVARRDLELARRSPLLWAELLPREVPILLLHGNSDWRVSPLEALHLAARFVETGQPHRLLTYEGAEHGIREFRDEANAEIVRWFVRYLDPHTEIPDTNPHGR